jgi:hypothetical protein
MDFDRDTSVTPQYLSYDDIDHLPYLKEGLSIFEYENYDKMRKRRLICAACGHPVTRVSEKVKVRGRHDHAFPYYGDIVRLGCFRKAEGCIGVERVSHGYSWFRGYAWQIQLCRNCYTQLGWKYMSEDDSFYGLVFKTLREEEADEDNGPPS